MQTPALKGFRLSLQQTRLWAMQLEDQMYLSQCTVLLEGLLDAATFRQACQHLIERHMILRTAFYRLPEMDVPVQVVSGEDNLSFHLENLEDVEADSQAAHIDSLFERLLHEPFNLAQGPLVRVYLLRLSNVQHVLLVSLPALCADITTLQLFIREISQAYAACLQGEQLTDQPLQYTDVSAWQNKLIQAEEATLPRSYWDKIDLTHLADTRLPFEHTRVDKAEQEDQSFVTHCYEMQVAPNLGAQIRALARQHNVSLEAFLLTCWQVVFWRLTDEPTAIIGVAVDGRIYEELENAFGLYTRFVPLPLSLEKDQPFVQLLQQVSADLEKSCRWQHYFTWEALPLSPKQEVAVFPVSFAAETWTKQTAVSGISYSLKRSYSCQERFALHLQALQVDEQLSLILHFDSKRLSSTSVQRISTSLQTLLEQALLHPQTLVSRLRLLDEHQRHFLRLHLRSFNRPLPQQPLTRLFEQQAQRTPHQLALRCGSQQMTYQQLNQRANQLAHALRRQGVGPNVLVALCLPRSLSLLLGMLAILKAGGAYLPLDPDLPPARLEALLRESQPLLLLTHADLRPRLCAGPTPCWDLEHSALHESPQDLPPSARVQDLLYVLYTSGSTGTPKGVRITQASLLNYLEAIGHQLAPAPGWQFGTVSTLAADLGHTVIFPALITGGCLHILPYELLTSGERLAAYTRHTPLDVLKIVPSHLQALLSTCPPTQQHDLLPQRWLVLGGEALPWSLLAQVQAVGSSARILNHYGPTETTVGVLSHDLGAVSQLPITEQEQRWGPTVPLGSPLSNVRAYILDRQEQEVPVGVVGELAIAGVSVAAGYLHQPEQTRAQFRSYQEPGQPPERIYKTGDLVRCSEEGEVLFVGRRDSQVKLRGYRIELGEIEAVLERHPQVREARVQLRQSQQGEPSLWAYLLPRQWPGPTAQELTEHVADALPGYMVPAVCVPLAAWPLTANGKLDRAALAALAPREQEPEGRGPRTPIEEVLVGIWQQVLKVERVGRHESFFSLGGHSLLATQVISRLRTALQIELPLRSLFEAPTVAGLAEVIEQVMRNERGIVLQPIVSVSREGDLPLSFGQQRLWFLDQLQPGTSSYNKPVAVRLNGDLHVAALERSLREIVRRHEILRTVFPMKDGQPIQLIGSVEAFHLSRVSLEEAREEERERALRQLVEEETQHLFDLARGPLLRSTLVTLAEREHVLLVTLHHIVTDGWSNGIFVRELTALYTAFAAEQASPLPDLPVQYADFAVWQRGWLQGEVLEAQRAYWKKRLMGRPRRLTLPTDHPRPEMETFQAERQSLMLPVELAAELKNLGQREGATLFMTLLAALAVLLARISEQEDIVIGMVSAGRARTELENLIGFFINTLVMRIDLSGNPSFLQVLQRVREVALEVYTNQDLPFEEVVKAVQPERTRKGSPLFQVIFDLQSVPLPVSELPGLTLRPLEFQSVWTTKFDLTVIIADTRQGMNVLMEYNTDLFNSTTIGRLLKQFKTLLASIAAQPENLIQGLELLTQDEREKQLMEQKMREGSRFKQLKNVKPKAISMQQDTMVKMELLRAGAQLPLVIQPAIDDIDVAGWVQANLEFVEKKLLEHGAILFRGFDLSSVPTFERFAQAMCQELFNENGEHPRESVSGNVYTPTFYPKDKHLLWHNENSFNYQWPMKIWFGCVKPAESGGETTIVDSRKMFELLNPGIKERFQQKNIMYVRNYRHGLGLNWREVFRTSSKAEVEERCRKALIDFEWKVDDQLKTRSIRPAIARHPKTGEWSWFNQAQHWHISCLDAETRSSLQALLQLEDMPRNCYYGDGSPIEDSVMEEICALYQQLEVAFPWQKGDVMLLDNMLTAHARNPYLGERKQLVAMGEMFSQHMLSSEG